MKQFIFFLLILSSCTNKKNENSKTSVKTNEDIILSSQDSLKFKKYVEKAYKYPQDHQQYLDSALLIKPNAAYLWQQKAMPLYKARKYSVGKPFLAKAVEHDPQKWLEYSGFMKCVFSKEYKESVVELIQVKERYGDNYVMDHTHNFYIGLNYLQLNEFEKAKEFLGKSKEQQFKDFPNDPPEEACHYLDWFYLGVVAYELQNYQEAIKCFDTSLKVYENFGEALYFKAKCLMKMDAREEAKKNHGLALQNKEKTINEDNAIYEVYPYQIFHKLQVDMWQ